MQKDINGAKLLNIQKNGTDLLNTSVNSELFKLVVKNTVLSTIDTVHSSNNWDSISIINSGASCVINLINPTPVNLSDSLKAVVTISTSNNKSSWDLKVEGLGNGSLMDSYFPFINIKASGNDEFLVPHYNGKIHKNPGAGMDFMDDDSDPFDSRVGLYPRGWGVTMQFMSYYNSNYGLYFGFHDPKAGLKKLGARDKNGGVLVTCKYPTPNRTVAGNNWELSGKFELDLFTGDWYDASMIYKNWVKNNADYWPQPSAGRTARQKVLGNIGAWCYQFFTDYSGNMVNHENNMREYQAFMDIPVGFSWYSWNNVPHDDDYPNFFPARTGLDTLITRIQMNDSMFVMPYINGRMFDTNMLGYATHGRPYATKKEDGSTYTQTFSGNRFAVMCPSQKVWQDTLTDANFQLTGRLGTSGIYIDMICAASPAMCYDVTHNHPLGGGDLWRTGHDEMFTKFHNINPQNRYITSEGGCDFLADQVDGFMVQGWLTRGQVPAFSAVYSGELQLFGTKTGVSGYGIQRFYGRLGQNFSFGVQTGRQPIFVAVGLSWANNDKKMAAQFIKTLGKMRHKMKDFMSFGEMLRPLKIDSVPILSIPIIDFATVQTETITAIQPSVWRSGDSVAFIFVNARIQTPAHTPGGNLSFKFDFKGTDYGFTDSVYVQKVFMDSVGDSVSMGNVFTQNVTLGDLQATAYIVTPGIDRTGINEIAKQKKAPIIFPNPTSGKFTIDLDNIKEIKVYSSNGKLVYSNISNEKIIDVSRFSKGVYLVKIETENGAFDSKLIIE